MHTVSWGRTVRHTVTIHHRIRVLYLGDSGVQGPQTILVHEGEILEEVYRFQEDLESEYRLHFFNRPLPTATQLVCKLWDFPIRKSL